MLDDGFSKNPSAFEGELYSQIQSLKMTIKELLVIINRNGIELDNEDDLQKLLIKNKIQ